MFFCFVFFTLWTCPLFSTGVIERWELLQAQAVSKEQCSSRDPQQLTSDLHDITSWLDRVIPELDRLQKPETAVSVVILEERVKQLKVSITVKDLNVYVKSFRLLTQRHWKGKRYCLHTLCSTLHRKCRRHLLAIRP